MRRVPTRSRGIRATRRRRASTGIKLHALNGGRDKLSQRDLTFVGVDTWPIVTPGWRSPVGLYLDDPLESFGLSPEITAMLRALTGGTNREQLEFLG